MQSLVIRKTLENISLDDMRGEEIQPIEILQQSYLETGIK